MIKKNEKDQGIPLAEEVSSFTDSFPADKSADSRTPLANMLSVGPRRSSSSSIKRPKFDDELADTSGLKRGSSRKTSESSPSNAKVKKVGRLSMCKNWPSKSCSFRCIHSDYAFARLYRIVILVKNKLFFYFNPFHANGLPTHLRKSENLHFSAVLKLEKTDFQQLTNIWFRFGRCRTL